MYKGTDLAGKMEMPDEPRALSSRRHTRSLYRLVFMPLGFVLKLIGMSPIRLRRRRRGYWVKCRHEATVQTAGNSPGTMLDFVFKALRRGQWRAAVVLLLSRSFLGAIEQELDSADKTKESELKSYHYPTY